MTDADNSKALKLRPVRRKRHARAVGFDAMTGYGHVSDAASITPLVFGCPRALLVA